MFSIICGYNIDKPGTVFKSRTLCGE